MSSMRIDPVTGFPQPYDDGFHRRSVENMRNYEERTGGQMVPPQVYRLPSNMKRDANGNLIPNNLRQASDLRGIEIDRQMREVGYSDMNEFNAASKKFGEEYDASQRPVTDFEGFIMDRGRTDDYSGRTAEDTGFVDPIFPQGPIPNKDPIFPPDNYAGTGGPARPQVYLPPEDDPRDPRTKGMYPTGGFNPPNNKPLNIKQVSPFATSIRPPKDPRSQGIMGNRNIDYRNVTNRGFPQQPQQRQMERPELMKRRPQQPNPFEGNEQYQALMDYQKTLRPNEDHRAQMQSLMDAMQPNQEQRDRMGELRTAFEGTGGYKDYRIQQMEQQLQQRRMQNPRMGMGLGGRQPQGMGMYGGFPQRPQRMPQGIMGGYGRPQQNPYQSQPYGGGMQGGYGGYGGMQGGYGQQPSYQQPQQMGGYGGYGGYGQSQQNPYGGMQGGYGGMNNYQQPQMPQPQYQPYQNPYQQSQPQPQQYGGYGMGQSQGGFGGYGGMSNPYQPQQYGNQNNSMGSAVTGMKMVQPQSFGTMY